jgi:YggT family protein
VAPILMAVLVGLKWLVFIDVILSWVMPNEDQFPRSLTRQITDPLYAPIRAIIRPEKTGGLDFSPLAILLLIHLMQNMLEQVR